MSNEQRKIDFLAERIKRAFEEIERSDDIKFTRPEFQLPTSQYHQFRTQAGSLLVEIGQEQKIEKIFSNHGIEFGTHINKIRSDEAIEWTVVGRRRGEFVKLENGILFTNYARNAK